MSCFQSKCLPSYHELSARNLIHQILRSVTHSGRGALPLTEISRDFLSNSWCCRKSFLLVETSLDAQEIHFYLNFVWFHSKVKEVPLQMCTPNSNIFIGSVVTKSHVKVMCMYLTTREHPVMNSHVRPQLHSFISSSSSFCSCSPASNSMRYIFPD